MLRFYYIILISLPFIIYYIFRAEYIVNHIENYSEMERYSIAKRIVNIVKKNGHIDTAVFGTENLPKDGGYVMYPNHQGKYDALGIIFAHEKPCTFVIDEKKSYVPVARQFVNLLEGLRLNKEDPRQQVQIIMDVVKRVKNGKRVIIFPEGGYDHNGNTLQDFMAGTFKCSVRSKTPIVPVAIKDSYKVFGINSLRRIKTEVHFLKPIFYEEYEEFNTAEIAEMVKGRIQEALGAE